MKNRIGEKWMTNEGYEVEIIEYISTSQVKIKFENGYINIVRFGNLKKGEIKNPFHPGVFKIGFFGVGKYKSRLNKKVTKVYNTWTSMLQRCYDGKFKQKNSTYKDCTVDERWHNFQVFAQWYEENYVEGWELDKDILVKDNKIYSPETCCFVPLEVNLLFKGDKLNGLPIGAYKHGKNFQSSIKAGNNNLKFLGTFKTPEEASEIYKKEKIIYIKKLADKYKNVILQNVYISMCQY